MCKWLWLSGLVGLIAGAFAILFQFLLQTVAHGCFETLAVISLLKLTGDGTTLSVMSAGYGALQSLLSSDGLATGAAVLLLIAFGKILTTSLTIGSGGSAGVFGPSMVIGGTLGTAVGQVMHHIAPSLVPHPAAFMIVGMAGFFSAAANTPLSTIFMVSEMTGSYELLIPAMWVCAIAFLAARRWTLYRSQVPSKLDSPAHFGEFAAEILADAPVSEVYKSTRKHAVIPGERKITKVFSEASRTSKRIFPVAGADGNVIGYFRLSDLTGALQNPAKIVQQTLARNLVLPNRQVVKLDDPVEKALDMMAHQHADEVLVTADDGTGRVIGIITSADLMLYYSCRLSQIRSEQAKELEAEGEEEAGPD